jgi:tRNA pseudouridine38-40 synthase
MESRYALRVGWTMDEDLMRQAAQDFIGTYDFKGFTSARCDKEITVRTVYYADLRRVGNDWQFVVAGSGFLYNMVRIMMGTLIDIGRGRLDRSVIKEMLETKDRTLGGKTVGPHGLSLEQVFYSDEERDAFLKEEDKNKRI